MARFAEFARLAVGLAGEASRLKKRAAIAEALARVVGEAGAEQEPVERAHAVGDAGLFCLYLAGQPFAEADPRKLNAGGALLTRVLKQVSGCTDAALATAYRRHGDLGAAAYDLLVAAQGGLRAAESEHPTHCAKDRAMNGAPGGVAGLTLDEVAEAFEAMAGARSTAARVEAVEGLLRRSTALEAKYLLKLMLGDMRIGGKQSLIEEAIAMAAGADVVAVRHAVMLEADLARVVRMAFAGSLAEARMRLFHPLGFMLASPVETPEEAVERFTEKPVKVGAVKKTKASRGKKRVDTADPAEAVLPVDAAEEGYARDVEMVAEELPVSPLRSTMELLTSGREDSLMARARGLAAGTEEGPGAGSPVEVLLEDKYDGMRAQVHCGDTAQPGRVAIYSRNREDITGSFPEIEEAFHGVEPVGGLIFDGELLGWDFVENKALPFSVLGQRIGRKRVDDEMRRRVPVVFMAFDLLFEGGELLLPRPLRERRARLEAVVGRLRAVTPLRWRSLRRRRRRGVSPLPCL